MMFSVLMSVYKKDNSDFLREALLSIFDQSLIPNEVILVKDGPLTKPLENVIFEFEHKYPEILRIVALKENVGLGNALRMGLEYCSNELIARMDSDDICTYNRFNIQVEYLSRNPSISVLGSFVEEFVHKIGDLKRFRKVPIGEQTLMRYSKFRNPLNHPSVMFRKSAVLESGSYINIPLFEDYYLWTRMLINGFSITNMDVPLLHFRIGNGMVGRRHGWSYMKKELAFLKNLLSIGFLTKQEYFFSLALKLPVRLLPKGILEFIYSSLLRKK